jgi:3-oxoacid CoA-transferase B subunit
LATKFEGLPREMIAMCAAKELKDGDYVNLGIGIPTLISDWIIGRDIFLQSEIGMMKTGPLAFGAEADQDLINASSQTVTELPGSSYFDIVESFSMIRGGFIDAVVLGALQVSGKGDLAGWANPERGMGAVGNIGGSMDLCVAAKKLIVCMEHTTKSGDPKIVEHLTYPATAGGVVNKIFTDLAVIEITPEGPVLREVFPGLTAADIQSVTGAKLIIPKDLKEIEL